MEARPYQIKKLTPWMNEVDIPVDDGIPAGYKLKSMFESGGDYITVYAKDGDPSRIYEYRRLD